MKRILIFVAFFSFLVGRAQGPVQDPCVRDLLSQYVDLVNDNVHTLWLYHERLENFNFELNTYYEASPSARKRLQLSFKHDPFTSLSAYFPSGMSPELRYRSVMGQNSCIPQPFRENIDKHITQIREIVTEVASISLQLETYTREGEYRLDPELKRPYDWLSRCYVLYHDISVIKDALYYELNKLYREQEDPDPDQAFARSTRSLMSVIVPTRSLLKAVKSNNSRQLQNNLSRLEMALNRVESEKEEYMESLAQPDAAQDPQTYFSYVLGVAEDLKGAVKEFLNLNNFPQKYQEHGKAYYYYNYRLIPIYNRFGEGMINRYNLLVEAADVPLLKMVEEPALFKVIPPGPQAQDPPPPDQPQKPDTVVAARPTPPDPIPPDTLPAQEAKPAPSLENAAPNNLVFLLDVSSSMEAPEKLPLLKSSFKHLLTLMRPQDRIAIVTYSGKARVILPSTSASARSTIMASIEGIRSEGKTDALEGMVQAYRIAQYNFIEEGNNRIIMASDGYFRIPEALPRLIAQRVRQYDIRLSVFFFGEAEERIMDRLSRLAEIGQGNFRYLRPENANQLMVEEAAAVKKGE
jgi:Ca-activated chloride channel family protein